MRCFRATVLVLAILAFAGGTVVVRADRGRIIAIGVSPDNYVLWTHPNPSSSRSEPVKEELAVKPGKVYELTLTHGAEKKR